MLSVLHRSLGIGGSWGTRIGSERQLSGQVRSRYRLGQARPARTSLQFSLLSDYAIWEYDYWASPCAFLDAYIPWTYYFNNRDMRLKWFFRTKSIDLEKVIQDKDCQSIVLVGHGSLNCWQATDMLVSNLEVSEMAKGIPKKTGEWLHLWCGRCISRENGRVSDGKERKGLHIL